MRFERKVTLKDGPSCLLRSGQPEDARAFGKVFCQTHGETDYLLAYPDESELDIQRESEWLAGTLDNPRPVEILAFVNGLLVGSAGISPMGSKFKKRHREDLGIAILKEFWGRGIGRALMQTCLDCARGAGFLQVELEVVADNAAAVGLYKSLGFVEFGRNPRAFCSRVSGWQEVLLMRLELQSRINFQAKFLGDLVQARR